MSNILPWEVLKLIFQYVHSQRYLAQCALVNSRWLYYAQNELYQSIHFYTFEQFLHFLAMATWADKKTSPIFMINHVTFHFDLLSICTALDIKEQDLYQLNISIGGHGCIYNYGNSERKETDLQLNYNIFDLFNGNDDDDDTKNKNTYGSSDTTTKGDSKKKKRDYTLVSVLLKNFRNIRNIEIVGKEKHMKQLRYMDKSQTDHYTFFTGWTNSLTHLPYWHNDNQISIAIRERQLQQLDIYASTSGIQIIDNGNLYFRLRTFPHLTHLYIDFFNQDQNYVIDRHIMNCIHKNCPLLTNLTLYNVDISILPVTDTTTTSASDFNSDNDRYPNQLHVPYRPGGIYDQRYAFNLYIDDVTSTMTSASSMKHLSLKNVKILHPTTTTTTDYLIQKYPHLKTIDLELDYIPFGVMSDDIVENRNEFQSAIFKLLTDLPDLTSFHYTLHPAINEECAKAIWPQEKILKWLSSHRRQLTSLSWPCDLYDVSLSPFSSLPQATTLRPTYLLNLKELNLTIGSQCGERIIFNDFLQVDGPGCCRKSILTCLESLTIAHKERALTLSTPTTMTAAQIKEQKDQLDKIKKNNKKIDIFAWLDICPRLKHLTLKGVDLVNTGDHDLKSDEVTRLKMKKERQEQTYTYPLNKLTLEQVDIYMDNGFDDICSRCPKLKELWCEYINCRWKPISIINYMKDYTTFCEQPIFTIHALPLALDTLYLGHINNVFQDYNYTFTIGKAMVYELGKSTLSYFKVMDSQYNQKEEEPIPFIEVHCRLADQVTWVGHSDQHDRDAFRGFLLQQKDNLDHIHLASLSRKGLKAYQEDKKDMEEWEYLDTNDDEPVYNEAEEGEEEEEGDDDDNDDDVNKYEVIEKEIEYAEEKKETSNSDDYDESEEEDDHDEEFLLY